MANNYLILRDKASVGDLVEFVAFGNNACKVFNGRLSEPLTSTDDSAGDLLSLDHRCIILVSIMLRRIIAFFRKPMELIGLLLEFFLNFWRLNGSGFLKIIANVLTVNIVLPKRGTETYFSTAGHIDTRFDLHKFRTESPLEPPEEIHESVHVSPKFEGQALMDLCIMASKLAYENANVVNNVVTNHWEMHFVGFYNCWNEYLKQRSTQVFMLCDKQEDANLILISFRGTELFNTDDWCTDLDYSFYEIPEMGKIHMGFLEALGLGSRDRISTVQYHLDHPAVCSVDNLIAFYAVRNKLKTLLRTHQNAKFVVTGHSLGGALAILFPAILSFHEETELLERLLAVYTFGQPRVGDEELERFMKSHLSSPVPRYFRVVYCNDIVPRLPFDDQLFLFKHFGTCLYYSSFYIKTEMKEEPNMNFFGIQYILWVYVIGLYELMRGLLMEYMYGEEYKETKLSILFRVLGLIMPGISAHSPANYVNCARLGSSDKFEMENSLNKNEFE